MSNKQKYHRRDRDAAVAELIAAGAGVDRLPAHVWEEHARYAGYSVRQLKRCVKQALADPAEATPAEFIVDDQVITYVFLAVGCAARAHRLLEKLGRTDLPSVRHFRRLIIERMGTHMIAYAKKGSRGARDAQLYLTNEMPHRNHTVQLDHTELPIWVVPRGYREPLRPWLTVAMDARHRYPLSWVLTFGRPSQAEVRACLVQAITLRVAPDGQTLVGGRPLRFVWDRGLEFLSTAITEACLRVGSMPVALPAYTPTLKAQLERFWRTLKEDLCTVPGYTDKVKDVRGRSAIASAALCEEEFVQWLAHWFDWYITKHVHSTLGCTPVQSWAADPTPLDEVSDGRLWDDFLVAKTGVKVSKTGIRFLGIDYTAPELSGKVGRKVEIRSLPHERSFIEVFLDRVHVCTAYPRLALTEDQAQAHLETRRRAKAEAQKMFTVANRTRRNAHESTVMLDRDSRGRPFVRCDSAFGDDLLTGGEQALAEFTSEAPAHDLDSLDEYLADPTEPGQAGLW